MRFQIFFFGSRIQIVSSKKQFVNKISEYTCCSICFGAASSALLCSLRLKKALAGDRVRFDEFPIVVLKYKAQG